MNEQNLSGEELRRRIAERLEGLDDESLLRLDAISQYAEERARQLRLPIGGATAEAIDNSAAVSRRRFLIGAGAGGLALAGTALGGALIGSALASPEAEKLKELVKMRALVALYEELEKAGLDTIVKSSIAAFGAALALAKAAGSLVSAGIKAVDAAVLNFERLFPIARQGVAIVEGLVSTLAKQMRDFQQVLSDVTGSARPVTDAIGKFFSDLLDKIPFGVGANVRDLINKLTALIGAVPTFIDSLNTNLIAPLRSDWFSDDDSKGLKGNLLEPVRMNLLRPADALVTHVTQLSDDWQTAITPINQVIAQRDEVRKQIVAVQAGKQ
jgi:hypothetical protein